MLAPITHSFSERDVFFMQRALTLATLAAEKQEVPVGAVLVLQDEIIGEGHNLSITQHDASAHAEIVAMRHAGKQQKNYRLIDTTLYVTLEPCMMCAAAMVHARIKRLVFGAADPKTGSVISAEKILDKNFLNHKIEYAHGLLAHECGTLLSHFFKMRRLKSCESF